MGNQNAQQAFDVGILSLGIEINDQQLKKDTEYAKIAFRRAIEWDSEMCDAWLGLLAAGEQTDEIYYQIYKTSKNNLYKEQRRLNLPNGILGGKFYTQSYIDYSLFNLTQCWCGYIASLIKNKEFFEANTVIAELKKMHKTNPNSNTQQDRELVTFMEGILLEKAEIWHEVLEVYKYSNTWSDEIMKLVSIMQKGKAAANLGLFSEAKSNLSVIEKTNYETLVLDAKFILGLISREINEEDQARAYFEFIYAANSTYPNIEKALKDKDFRIKIKTKEEINNRENKWDINSKTISKAIIEHTKENDDLLQKATSTLNSQIGLDNVKNQINKLKSTITMAKLREEKGLGNSQRSQHLVFLGPPGTGKTTIAKVVGQIYKGLGILEKDKVLEVSRKDLVGQYLGSTAIKTGQIIEKALGGVLFIDEAYTLIQDGLSGGDAFGKEAVDTLLAAMENNRENLVVIIAGYENEIERFIQSNEGLASRFSKKIYFDSYKGNELAEIADLMAKNRDSIIDPAAGEILKEVMQKLEPLTYSINNRVLPAIDYVGNARFVRNIVENAEEEREMRLVNSNENFTSISSEELMTISKEDMKKSLSSILKSYGFTDLV